MVTHTVTNAAFIAFVEATGYSTVAERLMPRSATSKFSPNVVLAIPRRSPQFLDLLHILLLEQIVAVCLQRENHPQR